MNKKQKDAAFIKKIQSLTIGTGSKPDGADEPKCPACGGGIDEHEIKIVGMGLMVERKRKQKQHDETHEESFSA